MIDICLFFIYVKNEKGFPERMNFAASNKVAVFAIFGIFLLIFFRFLGCKMRYYVVEYLVDFYAVL